MARQCKSQFLKSIKGSSKKAGRKSETLILPAAKRREWPEGQFLIFWPPVRGEFAAFFEVPLGAQKNLHGNEFCVAG